MRVSQKSTIVPLVNAAPTSPGGSVHIVLLVDQFPAVLGGGERVVLRLARLLRGVGYRISIAAFQVLCDPRLLETAGCTVYVLPIDNVVSLAGLRTAWQFGRFLRQQRVGIVMTFFESSNLFGGIATKTLSRARLIWNRRDMGILRERKHRAGYRLLSRLPDYVIAVSEEVRRHAVEVDGIPAERVGVVYNGIPVAHVQEHVWPAMPVVVSVGNLRRVKGQDTLVEAAAIVLQTRPEVRFQIAGMATEPEFFAQLQRRIAELGVAGQVRLLGDVQDVAVMLGGASVFVLPSRSEGFSNAILEAMAEGLPVVATRVGGNAEAVVDGETGLLVEREDATALAVAIGSVLDDPMRMQALGSAGRLRATNLFSEDEMVQRLRSIFTRVLEATGL